jgi:hypothetical protein
MVLTVAALAVAGCNKNESGEGKKEGGQSAINEALPEQKHTGAAGEHHEAVAVIDAQFELEPPRSTAGEAVALPWLEVTPVSAAPGPEGDVPKQPVKPELRWLHPLVLVGRRQVFVEGKPILDVACHAENPDLCTKDGLRAPTGKQALDFGPGDSVLAAVSGACAKWVGQDTAVLADRRLHAGAVERMLRSVAAAGAKPVLVVATYEGELVRLLPATVLLPPAPTPSAAVSPVSTAGSVGASGAAAGSIDTSGAGEVPDDVRGVTVRVASSGMSLELARQAGEPATPALLGNVMETLAAWAERLRAAAPAVTLAQVTADPDAPIDEVVRAVDAMRDSCAQVAKGTPCHERVHRFQVEWSVAWTPPAALPAVATPTAAAPAAP